MGNNMNDMGNNTGNQKKDKLIASCVGRFQDDCRRIEQQQDAIKKEQRLYQEVKEQMYLDGKRVYTQLNEFALKENDGYAKQRLISNQNQIADNQAQIDKRVSEYQEALQQEERKVSHEHAERERLYKKELQELMDQ